MAKDKRYTTAKNLILGGYIKSFREIFNVVPKSVVYKDLDMNNVHFNDLFDHVDKFILKDIFRIAVLLEERAAGFRYRKLRIYSYKKELTIFDLN